MRAFVTGATGLLGSNLVRTLREQGDDVVALARSPEKATRNLAGTGATVVFGDMENVQGFAHTLESVDAVFHTAAYFREYYARGDHEPLVDRLNVDATLTLAHAAQRAGVRRFVFTSSAGVVGNQPDGMPGVEDTPPWSGTSGNLYLRSKRRAEDALRELARQSGLWVAFALPSWMWGPHDIAPTPSGQLVLDALHRRLPPAVPPGGSSVVDARDVAAGMLAVCERGTAGERYILSAPYMELSDIVTQLCQLTGQRERRGRLPYAVAMMLATAAESWAAITHGSSAMSRSAMRLMNARLAVNPRRATEELGVTFRPFESTLADSLAWARESAA
jgi:dihydroflavonol-4-reductase